MATVSRTALTSSMLVVLLLPMTAVVLLQLPTAPSAHAFPIDDFGDSIRLTFNSAVSTNISSTVDDDGKIHVVWEDYRSGNGDIYYVKLDAEGNKLTNDAKISNDSEASRNPSVAVDSGGHIYIVWENIDNGSHELIFAKLWYYEGNITFEENGLQVSDSDPANSTEPDIAVCDDGNLALVWTDARHDTGDGNLEIYYKRLRVAGTSLTPDTRITGDVGRSEHPKLDIGPDGMVHVVWYDFRDSNNGLVINHGVFYRKLLPDGTPQTNETRITFASPQSKPDAAVDTDGNVHVVFDDDRYANFDIFYTLLDPQGFTIVDDRNISPKDGYQSRNPRIALSDSNAVDVVWQDNASDRWAVHYSAMDYEGEIEVYDQALTTDAVGNASLPIAMCAKDNNTFVIYAADYPNMEVFFSRTHRPDPAVFAADVSLSTASPLVSTYMWVNATVRNLNGDTMEDLRVRLIVDSTTVEDAVIDSLGAGEAVVATFMYLAQQDDGNITIIVDPDQAFRETDEGNNQVTLPIQVRIPGVDLESDVSSRSVLPGDDAVFTLTITNEGNSEFVFQLTNSPLEEGWGIDLGGVPYGEYSIPSGALEIVPVTVSTPEDAAPGTRTFMINVTCTERASINASITLMVDIVRFGQLTVTSPPGITVEPTIPVTFEFSISNSANANESFELEAEDDLGWAMSLSAYTIELAPDETVAITLTAMPSRYDPPGSLNTITLNIGSLNLTGNTAEGNILCLVGHHREVDLSLSGQAFVNMTVPSEREIVYTISVTNLGNAEDVFRVNLSGLDSFWAFLNTTYVFLDPGEEQNVVLTMLPGTEVPAGMYSFNVSVGSDTVEGVTDMLEIGVSILPFYSLYSWVDYDQLKVRKGNVAYVNLTIENMGNAPDTIDLFSFLGSMNATTAIVDEHEFNLETETFPPIALAIGGTVTILIKIVVPETIELGVHELLFDMSSLSDPSLMVSETITVIVEKKPSWLNLYTILLIVGIAAAVGVFALLLFRQREMREREKAEEERRKMQQPKRRPAVPQKARPKAP